MLHEPINQYDAHDDEEYDQRRRDEDSTLVKGGQGRSPEEITSNALQGAVMGMLWIALIFVVCLRGCF